MLHQSGSNSGSVNANLNKVGKTYLLKKVNTALGGSWTLEYEKNDNTYDLPQNKWVLSKVTTHDGFTGSGADTAFGPDITKTSFKYASPKYDRREREFLGFGTLTTKQLDPSNEVVFRTVINYYYNENIYLSGLAKGSATYNSANQLLANQSTLYNILNPDAPVVNLNAESNNYIQLNLAPSLLDKSRLFVAMVKTTSGSYENGQAQVSVKTVQAYNNTGNITSYIDGGSSHEDSYRTAIEYHLASSFEQSAMTGFPSKISVYKYSNNQLMRQRSASYNTKGSMMQIVTKLNATEDNTVVFGYDAYGNLNKVTENDNKNSTNTTM
ncbi:toxin TcdB middle/N-terminal domain-containing protein [Flavobacterium psychrotrophum]|uniref:toxin TcdB middle/N-terminal domain-containing protein n=1 Tax=Flavobacterium psychrotrophum TaxID=2294119 RepID=UPI000E316912|nr:toxin TcdB middle/N-terminal domain-containing protein [Flavobacterium psychrotrophum]